MANAYQKTIFLSSATLFALAAAPPAFAQNAATGGTKGVDSSDTEIIITAQKREERMVDVPISLTELTGAQLAAAGATKFNDRSQVAPGSPFEDNGDSRARQILVTGGP